MADRREGLLLDPRDLARELLAEQPQITGIHGDPGLLHLDEHVDQWKLHVAVEPFEIETLELDRELLAETGRGDRAGARACETFVECRRAVRVLAVGSGKRRHLEPEALRR